jgi:hypothetical protein
MIDQLDDVQWGKMLAEAWINPDFKNQLESDPSGTIRDYARKEFGIEIECDLDALTLPEPPGGMEGEHLSMAAGAAGTVTGCASAGGNVQASVTGSASAGGNVQASVTGSASAGGNVQASVTGSASAGGN